MKKGLRIYEKALRRKNRVLHEAMFKYPREGRYSQSGSKYILFPFEIWKQDRKGNWFFYLDEFFKMGLWGGCIGSNRHNHEEMGMRLFLSDLLAFGVAEEVAEKHGLDSDSLGWDWYNAYHDKDKEKRFNKIDAAVFELTGVRANDLSFIDGGRGEEVGYKYYEYPTPKK